jgi:hypothetical protein
MINLIKDDTLSGSLNYLSKLPVLNMMPIISLYHVTNLAEKTFFQNDFLEYDFSPRSMKFIQEQREDLLKPINS